MTNGQTRVLTFGDSILDCAIYNDRGITPGALLARNDDVLFPEFRGRDLTTLLGRPVREERRARDGSTVSALAGQIREIDLTDDAVVLLTVGGNDLLQGLATGSPERLAQFEHELRAALARLARTKLFVGNVYDPTFGQAEGNDAYVQLLAQLGVDPAIARRAYERVNEILAAETTQAGGTLVDLHAHFLSGDARWFTRVIEPSLIGASEVRRAFLSAWEASAGRSP